jgi:hypothetical protein
MWLAFENFRNRLPALSNTDSFHCNFLFPWITSFSSSTFNFDYFYFLTILISIKTNFWKLWSSCDFFAHFTPNYFFKSFVYLTLDDMAVRSKLQRCNKHYKMKCIYRLFSSTIHFFVLFNSIHKILLILSL